MFYTLINHFLLAVGVVQAGAGESVRNQGDCQRDMILTRPLPYKILVIYDLYLLHHYNNQ